MYVIKKFFVLYCMSVQGLIHSSANNLTSRIIPPLQHEEYHFPGFHPGYPMYQQPPMQMQVASNNPYMPISPYNMSQVPFNHYATHQPQHLCCPQHNTTLPQSPSISPPPPPPTNITINNITKSEAASKSESDPSQEVATEVTHTSEQKQEVSPQMEVKVITPPPPPPIPPLSPTPLSSLYDNAVYAYGVHGVIPWILYYRYPLTGLFLLSCIGLLRYQISRGNSLIHKKDAWCNWHDGYHEYGALTEPQQINLVNDLLLEIAQRYFDIEHPMQNNAPLRLFFKSLYEEHCLLESYILYGTKLCAFRLNYPLFPVDDSRLKKAKKRIDKLSFFKKIVTSILVQHNYGNLLEKQDGYPVDIAPRLKKKLIKNAQRSRADVFTT